MVSQGQSRSPSGKPVAMVPLAEAKNHLSALVARVEQGEDIAITRRGVCVARLVRETATGESMADRAAVVNAALLQLRKLRNGCLLEGDLKGIGREGLD